jgi:error-prone DNA polymerase
VVWPGVFERYRRVVMGAQLLVVRGRLQREGIVIHVVADVMIDRSDLLARLGETSEPEKPFQAPVARADEIRRPHHEPRIDGFTSRDFH